MKRILFFLCFTLPLFLNISGKNKAEKLLLGGSGWNKIVIIEQHASNVHLVTASNVHSVTL